MTVSVKRASVVQFGAVGDGSTDDTTAIQAAVDYVTGVADRGMVLFPRTSSYYKTTAPITINEAASFAIVLAGEAGAEIRGNFSGYIIDRDGVPTSGPRIIERLYIRNTHASGGAVRMIGVTNGVIRECRLTSDMVAIDLRQDTFTFGVQQCIVGTNGGVPTGSRGILTGGHSNIIGCDITGFDEAIRAWGSCVNIIGCRIEVNKTGMMLGIDPSDADHALTRASISGNSFEANDTAIYAKHVAASVISGNGAQGSVSAPSGQSKYGFRANFLGSFVLQGFATSGAYDTAAIQVDSAPELSVFQAVSGGNSHLTGADWVLPGDLSGLELIQCDN